MVDTAGVPFSRSRIRRSRDLVERDARGTEMVRIAAPQGRSFTQTGNETKRGGRKRAPAADFAPKAKAVVDKSGTHTSVRIRRSNKVLVKAAGGADIKTVAVSPRPLRASNLVFNPGSKLDTSQVSDRRQSGSTAGGGIARAATRITKPAPRRTGPR